MKFDFLVEMFEDLSRTDLKQKVEDFIEKHEPKAAQDNSAKASVKATSYSSGKQLYSLDVPGWKSSGVEDIVHITCKCVVACGRRKVNGNVVWQVWMWMLPSKTPTVIMQTKVRLVSVAALGKDEVVVLARDPKGNILRIVNLVTKDVRSINLKVGMERSMIEGLWEVEVDNHGRFLITCDELGSMHLFLVDGNGSILHDIQTRDQCFPTFCIMRGMAVLCSHRADLITCYKLQDDAMTEVIRAPHGWQGFVCCGICSGSSGEIFITGLMEGEEPHEVRVYQAEIDAKKKTIVMKGIRLDNDLRSSRWPKCALHENTLSVSSNDRGARIGVFHLSP